MGCSKAYSLVKQFMIKDSSRKRINPLSGIRLKQLTPNPKSKIQNRTHVNIAVAIPLNSQINHCVNANPFEEKEFQYYYQQKLAKYRRLIHW